MAATNGTLTKDSIGNEWNLRTEMTKPKLRGLKWKKVYLREWVLYLSH